MKKTIFVLVIFLFSIFGNIVQAETFYPTYTHLYPDVDFTHKYAPAIYGLTVQGVFSGYPDGTFQPEKTLNRAELVKVLVELAYYGHDKEYYVDKKCFSDIMTNEWYTKYVCFAKDKGQLHGYPDGTFRPEDEVNLVEALKMYLMIDPYASEVEKSDPWYKAYVEAASYVIPHDFMNFDQSVTRAQMAQLLERGHTDLAYMDIGVPFLWETFVTYETLENNIDVEAIAKSTDKIKNAAYVQYEDYELYGYKAVLYSEDAEVLSDEGVDDECYGGYYGGHFKFAIVDTVDDEMHYLKGITDLGEIKVPEDGLHKVAGDMGDWTGPWMMVEKYASCIDSLFAIYEPGNNYFTYPKTADLDNTEEDWFYADSVDDITFDNGTITAIHNGEEKIY